MSSKTPKKVFHKGCGKLISDGCRKAMEIETASKLDKETEHNRCPRGTTGQPLQWFPNQPETDDKTNRNAEMT